MLATISNSPERSSRRRWVVVVLALCAVLAWVLYRGHLLEAPNRVPAELSALRSNDAATRHDSYAEVPTVALSQASPEMLAAGWGDADVRGSLKDQRASTAALLQDAAEFVRLRFIARDFDAYVAWRTGHGFRWKTLDSLEKTWTVVSDYPAVFGVPAPRDADIPRFMRDYWSIALDRTGGMNNPARIATHSPGVVVRLAHATSRNAARSLLDGSLGTTLWHGPSSATMRSWFVPPTSRQKLIAEHGGVDAAEIGLILEFADGSRRPLQLGYFFDPVPSKWMLEHVNMNNTNAMTETCLEY